MIVFIGCGKKKNNHKCEAQYMYLGRFFNTCLNYARTFESDIYILSAKYGILHLSDEITPYDLTLNTMNKEERANWYDKVKRQAKELHLDTDQEVIFLCGKNYYEGLLSIFPNNKRPLDGIGGIGCQMSFMNNKLKRKLF